MPKARTGSKAAKAALTRAAHRVVGAGGRSTSARKNARNGKRSWRKNIDTAELEAAVKHEADEVFRYGARAAVEAKDDDELFFEDEGGARQAGKRRRAEKALKCFANLDKSHAPMLRPERGIDKGRAKKAQTKKLSAEEARALVDAAAAAAGTKAGAKGSAGSFDLWGSGEQALAAANDYSGKRSGKFGLPPAAPAQEVVRPRLNAVAVDPAGCSYNPDEEQRQDAVAAAVAAEVQKQLREDIFRGATRAPKGGYLMPVDAAVQDIVLSGAGALPGADGEKGSDSEGDESEDDVDLAAVAAAKRNKGKLTRAQRNKKRRAAELEKELERARAEKRMGKDINQAGAIVKQLKREKRERAEELAAAAEARAARAEPLRLAKERFEDMPLQVLTEDETHVPMRRLKPCPAVLMDRYKGLQRSGAIEPRKRQASRKSRHRKYFVRGTKGEKEELGHAALQAEIAMRKAKAEPDIQVKN